VLSGIHPILTGDLLAALDRRGHGDELVFADANFPAHRFGPQVVEAPGLSSPAVVTAIRTGELRPYGNVILRKGVVNEYAPKEAAR
jgi:L-fucose mutarotase/ribose pyranase (RbsD/FucU family)